MYSHLWRVHQDVSDET
jgi:hypothetical protein